MRTPFAALLLIVLAFAAAPAVAEEAKAPPAESHAGPPPEDGKDAAAPKKDSEEHFSERKTKILQHLTEHIAKLQEAQRCVAAAKKPEDLRACRPQRPAHAGGTGEDEGHEPGGPAPEPEASKSEPAKP
jgi:hypothetical protein